MHGTRCVCGFKENKMQPVLHQLYSVQAVRVVLKDWQTSR